MKKLIIMCSLILSGFAFANQSDNPYIYDDESSKSTLAEGDAPAGPGDPNAAPVDQYIPYLLVAGLVIAFVYGRRKEIA